MDFDYRQICSNLIKNLAPKQKEVVLSRFGLNSSNQSQRQTLESIGRSFGITRERVRQIEKLALTGLVPKDKDPLNVFHNFSAYFAKQGGLKKESIALDDLGKKQNQNQVYFLLTLAKNFKRFGESGDLYAFWTSNGTGAEEARGKIKGIVAKFVRSGKPLLEKDIAKADLSYLEISKTVQKNKDNFWGLKEWPEINPRGVKDKAYLVFKKAQKPLHFTEAAVLIGNALPQTVHNELIKDSRFVLVGRGLYALKEWGYEPGFVKDVIAQVIKQAQKPLSKELILENVLRQREVKENTVLLNLSNRKYFLKTPQGCYKVKEA